MRVTSKGQVTIPQEFRERAGIHPGDDVDFVLDGERLCVVKSQRGPTRGEQAVARLREHGRRHWQPPEPEMSTDELMALLRGE